MFLKGFEPSTVGGRYRFTTHRIQDGFIFRSDFGDFLLLIEKTYICSSEVFLFPNWIFYSREIPEESEIVCFSSETNPPIVQ